MPERGKSEKPLTLWFMLPLVPAAGLSFLSFVGRYEDWESVAGVRAFNFLAIGPLWALTAFLCSRGKTRIALCILAWILPASGLSLFQSAVAHIRFTPTVRTITANTMRSVATRIQTYTKQHQKVPPALSVLPDEMDSPGAVDEWGNDIQYSVDQDGVLTLSSLGADGKVGGEGRNADIVVRYRTHNDDGTLNVNISDARIGVWIGGVRAD